MSFSNEKYDIFISFKNTDNNTTTIDTKIANELRKNLESEGYSVFLSTNSLLKKGIDRWEDELYRVLAHCKVFIALSSNSEYLSSKWVFRERSRFLAHQYDDRCKSLFGYLITPMSKENLPDDMQGRQCFQHEQDDAIIKLLEFISNHFKEIQNHNCSKGSQQLTSKLGKSTIIGRKEELSDIDKLIKSNGSLLLINGIGGVGKSHIASYYLYSHKNEYSYYGFFDGLDSFTTELKAYFSLKSEKIDDILLEALAKLRKLDGNKLIVIDDIKDTTSNKIAIEAILGLKDSKYKILITSRETIENIEIYNLNILSPQDAKDLFNSISKIDDEDLLVEILKYLDYHALFINKTAHSIKHSQTPQMILDRFRNGEFPKINIKRRENFNKYLNDLFELDELDNDEILLLKRLSLLPPIDIEYNMLVSILGDDGELEMILEYLSEKGWLTHTDTSYKLHQIISPNYAIENPKP